MYTLTPQAAEPRRDVVHDSEFCLVGVAYAVGCELYSVRRQCLFDSIGLGDFPVAYHAYVFSSNLLYFNVELTASVTTSERSDSAGDPKGFSF